MRFWWVLLIVVIGIGALIFREHLSGAAADLRVGDCIDLPTAQTEITEVQHRPCVDPHDAEVFAVLTHPAAEGASYPGEQAMSQFVFDACEPLYATFRGQSFESDTAYDIGWFYPTRAGWSEGDRGVTCHIMLLDGGKITGSLRAAAP